MYCLSCLLISVLLMKPVKTSYLKHLIFCGVYFLHLLTHVLCHFFAVSCMSPIKFHICWTLATELIPYTTGCLLCESICILSSNTESICELSSDTPNWIDSDFEYIFVFCFS